MSGQIVDASLVPAPKQRKRPVIAPFRFPAIG
jgi:hypothetical protein